MTRKLKALIRDLVDTRKACQDRMAAAKKCDQPCLAEHERGKIVLIDILIPKLRKMVKEK
jgi:hypothetical protein